MFEQVQPLTLFSSLKSMRLHLWDEGRRRLVSFRQVRQERRLARQAVRAAEAETRDAAVG
jgi:hypothetical protein